MILCLGLMCWEEVGLIYVLWHIKSKQLRKELAPVSWHPLLGPKYQTYSVVTRPI